MKYTILIAAACLCIPAFSQDLTAEKDKTSYSVGVQMGKALKMGKDLLDLEVVIRGIQEALAGKDLALEDAEIAKFFQQWQVESREAEAKVQSAEGDAFLQQNAKREGVTVLPSGLQYEVLKEGSGPSPAREDVIRAHYKGALLDGTVFDSSYDRGEPIEAPVTRLIPAGPKHFNSCRSATSGSSSSRKISATERAAPAATFPPTQPSSSKWNWSKLSRNPNALT